MRNVISLAIGLAVAAGVASPASAATAPEVFLHRGGISNLATENTLENFVWADNAVQSDKWEMDIRFAKNNIPVLEHDPNYADRGLFSCNKTVLSVSITWAKANCLDKYGNTPSSLADVTKEMKLDGATAWMELKTVPTADQWTVLETRISSLKTKIVIESFYNTALAEASSRGYETARLIAPSEPLTLALPSGTDWTAPSWERVTSAYVTSEHASGRSVAVWTPDPADWSSLPDGVDLIISNYARACALTCPSKGKKK